MSLARKYRIVPTSSPWVSEDVVEFDVYQNDFPGQGRNSSDLNAFISLAFSGGK